MEIVLDRRVICNFWYRYVSIKFLALAYSYSISLLLTQDMEEMVTTEHHQSDTAILLHVHICKLNDAIQIIFI